MIRTILDRQLHALSEQLLQLWNLNDQAFEQGLQALKQRDPSFCQRAISYKPQIETTRADIQKQAFHVLTLQQPLGGRDLRFVTAIPAIAAELDHIAGGGVEAARLLIQAFSFRGPLASTDREAFSIAGEPEETAMADLLELGLEARRVLGATLKAFATHDARSAFIIWHDDKTVSQRYEIVRDELIDILTKMHTIPVLYNDKQCPRRIANLLWIAHRFGRVEDHCNSICERTIFIAEGHTALERIRR